MNAFNDRFYQLFSLERPFIWMFFCILWWIVSLRGFLFSYNALSSDAMSYYDHTKYFVESIQQGVFPLWDYFWQNGAPNDFFLRRIGCYNPLYLLMALVNFIGVPFRETYIFMHAFYYFLGAGGLFLLGRKIWGDERPAFLVFALFLFSAIGTRIFDSYMCLMIVPLVWFFYFVYAFLSSPARASLAGLVLTFMIMVNTYIPLYVMTILVAAFFFWVAIFPKEALFSLVRAWKFFQQHWVFSLGMLFLMLCAFIPPVLFFKQGSQGAIALPGRHSAGVSGNVISVDKHLLDWGLIEDVFFSSYFTDLRRYIFPIIFIPTVSLMWWGMGAFCRLNRRIVFYVLFGLFVVLLGTPRALPLYDFLYQHVFYFKYFRNLHFFLWFLVIPLFIFTAGEFCHSLLQVRLDKMSEKFRALAVVVLVHIGLLVWILLGGYPVITTVCCLVVSCCFCGGYIFFSFLKVRFFWLAVVLVTAPQALEVYQYASVNMPRYTGGYQYDALNTKFLFSSAHVHSSAEEWMKRNDCSGLYYSAATMYQLCDNVSSGAYGTYLANKLTAYSKVVPFAQGGYARLEQSIRANADLALAEDWQGEILGETEGREDFRKDTKELKVVSLNASGVLITTDFKAPRFLVYNDSWDKDWRVYIDGKKARLYKANAGFKGVVVPPGVRRIHFQYGSFLWAMFNWFLFAVFNALFVLVFYLYMKKIPRGEV